MRHRTTILLGLVAILIASDAFAKASRPSLELNAVEGTLDEVLEASGLNDVEQDHARKQFLAIAERGWAALGGRALPVVVAAAVRVGDWDEAECMADRFAPIELDRVESGRLHAWVRGRRSSHP